MPINVVARVCYDVMNQNGGFYFHFNGCRSTTHTNKGKPTTFVSISLCVQSYHYHHHRLILFIHYDRCGT